MHISSVLGDWLASTEEPNRRHPVTRRGDRDPIPWLVRLSVARRDGFNCRACGHHMPEMVGMEIDHILPWSAGGGDHSSNLRTLCSPCNQRRSNFDDGAHTSATAPTTWWCSTCWLAPEVEAEQPDDFLDNYAHMQRTRRPIWGDGTDLSRPPFVRDPSTLAYCAWCWGYGYTDLAFTRELQGDLAATTNPRTAT